MNPEIKISLIGSAAVILTAIGTHFFKPVMNLAVAWINKKSGNIAELRQKNKELEAQVDKLEAQLKEMNLRMAIIIPLLRKSFKTDPEAIELLSHLDIDIINQQPPAEA